MTYHCHPFPFVLTFPLQSLRHGAIKGNDATSKVIPVLLEDYQYILADNEVPGPSLDNKDLIISPLQCQLSHHQLAVS